MRLSATKLRLVGAFSGGALCALMFWWGCRPFSPQVIACDVGQGDAILLVYGTSTVVIDFGRNQAIVDCLGQKLPFGQFFLAAAILSHWDSDHIGGFSDVVQTYSVGTAFTNPKQKTTKEAEETMAALERADRSIVPELGDELVFPGGRLRFVWSKEAFESLNPGVEGNESENPSSIGIQAAFPGFGFLSLGDLECAQELAVSSLPLLTSSAILKVSHHGSKTASCTQFLAKISPEIALISVGAGNTYGHPASDVLENLRFQGIEVLRTDQTGSLELQRWGKEWLIQSDRPPFNKAFFSR